MIIKKDLHKRLVDLQSDEELERKRDKAARRGFWTGEDLDWAKRWAKTMRKRLGLT